MNPFRRDRFLTIARNAKQIVCALRRNFKRHRNVIFTTVDKTADGSSAKDKVEGILISAILEKTIAFVPCKKSAINVVNAQAAASFIVERSGLQQISFWKITVVRPGYGSIVRVHPSGCRASNVAQKKNRKNFYLKLHSTRVHIKNK